MENIGHKEKRRNKSTKHHDGHHHHHHHQGDKKSPTTREKSDETKVVALQEEKATTEQKPLCIAGNPTLPTTHLDNTDSRQPKFWLQPNFCLLIVGVPGTGKSTLLGKLLGSPNEYLWKQFHWVFFFSTNKIPMINECHRKENWFVNLEWTTLCSILGWLHEEVRKKGTLHKVLFVFDDKILDLKGLWESEKEFVSLFTNRRHFCEDLLNISFIITSQRYTKLIPPTLRVTCSDIITFRTPGEEFKSILQDHCANWKAVKPMMINLWSTPTVKHSFLHLTTSPIMAANINFTHEIPLTLV